MDPPPGHGIFATDTPATDADRDLALRILREGASHGLIGFDELDSRVKAVLDARLVRDLVSLTRDVHMALPVTKPKPRRFWKQAGFNYHAMAYGLTNSLLVGTWALTGAHFFWPFFPIAGWGIGLGVHALVAAGISRPSPASPGSLPADLARLELDQPPGPQGSLDRHMLLRVTKISTTPIEKVTVMFADVAGSTQLNEALGDAAWNTVRVRFLDMVRHCVAEQGGVEVSTQGDGILARFSRPVQAVACAFEIHERSAKQRAESGFAPSMRIGIHAGEAVADGTDIVGNAVNLAARVTAEARIDQILVTEQVADAVGTDYQFDDCGLRTLKGFSRPRHLLALRLHAG